MHGEYLYGFPTWLVLISWGSSSIICILSRYLTVCQIGLMSLFCSIPAITACSILQAKLPEGDTNELEGGVEKLVIHPDYYQVSLSF